MANELSAGAPSGGVLYAVLRNVSGQPYNTITPGFETYVNGNWASYALTMTEQGTSGIYVGSMPTGLAAGLYGIDIRVRTGGTPATSDSKQAAGSLPWTGSIEAFVLADSSGRPTVAGYASGQDPATLVLVTPANKLATDSSGRTTVGTNADKTGYTAATVQDKTGYTVSTVQDKTGYTASTVQDKTGYALDLTQAVPVSNTAQTVGDALNGARAQSFGKWVLQGTQLQLFAADGTTVVRTFVLDSATIPTRRT